MFSTCIGRLRLVGLLEGISFLLLLLVAMPLKYAAGLPQAVSVVGMAHGILFLAYLLMIALVMRKHRWPMNRGVVLVAASLLPGGPFFVDGRLKREQRGLEHTTE